eukprot:49197-Hanusia_phi.AAC.1
MDLRIRQTQLVYLNILGDIRDVAKLKGSGNVKLISKASITEHELLDICCIFHYNLREYLLNGNIMVRNHLIFNNHKLFALAANGSYSLGSAPYGATVILLKDGEEAFRLIGRGDISWDSSLSLLTGAITTTFLIPHTAVNIDLDHFVSLSLGYRGSYVASVDVYERRGALFGSRLVPPSAFSLRASAVLRDMPENTVASFLNRFALATAGLDVFVTVALSGRTAVVVTSVVESDGDMRGDTTRMSCLGVDLGFYSSLWIALFGDLRLTRFSVPWALESFKNYDPFTAMLQYILIRWRLNDLQDTIQDSNDLYKDQVPHCDASSSLKLLISLGDSPYPAWPSKTPVPDVTKAISMTPEPTVSMPLQQPFTNISQANSPTSDQETSIYVTSTPMADISSTFFILRITFLETYEDSHSLDYISSVATNISNTSSQATFECTIMDISSDFFDKAPSLDTTGNLHSRLKNNTSGDSLWKVKLVDGNQTYISPVPLRILVHPVNDPPSFVVP